MKLYDWSPAPNPRRVRLFLLEKEIDIPIEDVGGDDLQLSSTYKRRYPEAMVPMLELDDGTQIGEAMAICRYLETLHPEMPLMGTDPLDTAIIDMWERRAWEQGMMPCSDVFRNTVPEFTDRSLAGRHVPLPQIEALVDRGRVNMDLFFDKFDAKLKGREFLASDRYTVADITTLTVVDFAEMTGIGIPARCADLRRWYDAVSARPSAGPSAKRTDGKPNIIGK
jgi:glutathione S-transferase